MPPIRKLKKKPSANSIGTVNLILAFQNVPMPTRKMKPVGIEISSVVSMNSGRMSGLIPLSNRWCCQTKKLSSAHPDHAGRGDLVAEQRLAAEHREHLEHDAEAGQGQDVHLGMAEEPEQVLAQVAAAAELVGEERGLHGPVE